jgi:uncharacterized protein
MNSPSGVRFIADVMLGRLAKWLRVMGYDTHYPQPSYKEGLIGCGAGEGRLLLSRNKRIIERYQHSLLIVAEDVRTQLKEMSDNGCLPLDRSRWFTRCLICNMPFKKISLEDARAYIPEYILSQNSDVIHFCPSCKRYFWPGSHRTRMLDQISLWRLYDK